MSAELLGIIVMVVGLIFGLGFGFMFGKFHERMKWNELIRTGVLPMPKRSKQRKPTDINTFERHYLG